MAANMFIKISDIPGNADDKKHKDWIVIQNMFFELERPVDMTDLGSPQRGQAIAYFQKIEVTSQMSIASNLLALSVAKGTVRPKIELHVCRPSGNAFEGLEAFSIWTLHDAIIDSYGVTSNEAGIPEETWTIVYKAIKHEYRDTDPQTGRLDDKKKNDFNWNLINDTEGKPA